MINFILLTDGYKLDHRRQYPDNTQFVMSNWTARATRIPNCNSVVFFGLQYFLKKYFQRKAYSEFFSHPLDSVVQYYKEFLDGYLGPAHGIDVEHISELHKLGYIPLKFRALPEGTSVPLRVPMFTVENTHPDFAWVTNYFETLISCEVWQACTSASLSKRMRKILIDGAVETGGPVDFVDWQGHDFSFRGMAGANAAAISGAAHLLSFKGTDTLPAIELLKDYYDATGLIGGSVPATEHSVMCAGGKEDELQTFDRLLGLYPKGIVSVVSDTWDLWNVIGNILPQIKDKIMAREGKLVIRPDSGDPVDILCGEANSDHVLPHNGVIESLWNIFGGTVNATGFKELDPHIGAIYGDSITEDRAQQICERLKAKGFATTNVVLGVGSYSYQYVTRDTHGFAIKATWAKVNGEERMLSKDPITDNGTKKSAKGRLVVLETENGGLHLLDGLSQSEESWWAGWDQLQPVWQDGEFLRRQSLEDIRKLVNGTPS
jgi:nicotinamide phosphoribosyltransferase